MGDLVTAPGDDRELAGLLVTGAPPGVDLGPLPGPSVAARTTAAPVPLPPRASEAKPEPDLIAVVTRRRSGAFPRPGVLQPDAVGALLAGLTSGLPEPLADPAPAIFPLLLSVAGIAPGCYRYEPADHHLVPVRPVSRDHVRAHLMLQREHADASAVLFLVAPLAAWLRRGDRGYRYAAMQQGWLADRLYLRAEALGLRYRATGGFPPSVVDRLLGLDGQHHTAMLAFLVDSAETPRDRHD